MDAAPRLLLNHKPWSRWTLRRVFSARRRGECIQIVWHIYINPRRLFRSSLREQHPERSAGERTCPRVVRCTSCPPRRTRREL